MAEISVVFEVPDHVIETNPDAYRNIEMLVLAAMSYAAGDDVFGHFRLWLTSSGAPPDIAATGAALQPGDLRTLVMSIKIDGKTIKERAAHLRNEEN